MGGFDGWLIKDSLLSQCRFSVNRPVPYLISLKPTDDHFASPSFDEFYVLFQNKKKIAMVGGCVLFFLTKIKKFHFEGWVDGSIPFLFNLSLETTFLAGTRRLEYFSKDGSD